MLSLFTYACRMFILKKEHDKCDKFIHHEFITLVKTVIYTFTRERAVCHLIILVFCCWCCWFVESFVYFGQLLFFNILVNFLSNRMLIPSNVQMEPLILMKVGNMSVNVSNAQKDTIVSRKAWKKR